MRWIATDGRAVGRPAARSGALLLLFAGFWVLTLAFAPIAAAHATVASSDPADGARLTHAPAQVNITFDEPVGLDLGYLRVIDASGASVGAGQPTHPAGQGPVIGLALQPGLGDSTYLVSWRVISADSHPVGGTFRFVVGDGVLDTAAVAAAPVVAVSTGIAFDVARTAGYLSLVLLGGGWLLVSVWPAGRTSPAARRVLVIGWIVAVVGAVAETLLQGAYAAGTPLSGVLQLRLFANTVGSDYGRLHLLRILLLSVLGAMLDSILSSVPTRTPIARRVLVVLVFLAVVFTFSASGHAAVARPGWLNLGSDMAHLVAMSAWIGGLVLLFVALLPRRDPVELRVVLPAFSRVACVCVLVIAVTGTYQGWRESGTVAALTTTTYGRLVLFKAVLFAVLLLLGNVSRLAVQRRYVRQPDPTGASVAPGSADTRRIRRSVLAEIGLAAVVLIASGILVAEPPGRTAVAASPAMSASASTALDGSRSITVTVSPARHGTVAVDVTVHGGPASQQVTMTASLPTQQLGPLPVALQPASPLTYHAAGLLLPVAGQWTFGIVVRASEFDAVTTSVQIPVT